jgi:antitoxin component YwqK of YwqJK toxin-antitoxin module
MRTLILLMGLFLSVSAYSQQNIVYEQDPVTEVITYKKYHDNGILAEEGTYNSKRQLHGKFYSYNLQGKLLTEAKFKNGLKHGVWKHYDDQKVTKVEYYFGRMIKATTEINFSKENT